MKSIMIIFNQASTERVEYMLDTLGIQGFTFWENVQGRGSGPFGRPDDEATMHSTPGTPHRGTHTWPEMNNAILTVVDDDQVEPLLTSVRKLDRRNAEVGIRAFVWAVEQSV